jgi:hypothetical protein
MTHVIYMRGVETPLEQSRGTDDSLARIFALASGCGVGVVSGTTNIRTFFTRHWERYYFGSGLAAIAAALSGGLSTVCIPAGHSYSDFAPEGSNPITDPLLATEACHIVHDGGEVTRAERLEISLQIAPTIVRPNLRVCTANDGGAFNCGACYKCVRTMVILDILGELEKHTLFNRIDRRNWKRNMLKDHHDFNRQALAFAHKHRAVPSTIRLLQKVVNKTERFDAMTRLVKHSPLNLILPSLRAVRDRLGISARMHKV